MKRRHVYYAIDAIDYFHADAISCHFRLFLLYFRLDFRRLRFSMIFSFYIILIFIIYAISSSPLSLLSHYFDDMIPYT